MNQKDSNGAHSSDQQRILQKMNELRALHGAHRLSFDDNSEWTRLAEKTASETVGTGRLCHSVTKDYGQNMFMMSSDWNFDG